MVFKSNKLNKSNKHKIIQAKADFVKIYHTYDELISDAEIVAFGTVNNVKSYIDNHLIVSKFDFKISSADKGNISVDEVVYVQTNGGKVKFADYLDDNKEYLEIKTSPEYIAKQKNLHGNEYIELIFERVPNIQDGDQLVLFLSKLDNNSNYHIVGSCYFGKFYYNEDNNEIYKEIIENSKNTKNTAKKEMIITREDFKKKIQNSKDNNMEIKKEENQNKLKIKDNIEIQKNKKYDKYKK